MPAAVPYKDYELPFKVTDALGCSGLQMSNSQFSVALLALPRRVVYIPPSDVFPPEGRWAAMTYEVQDRSV